MTAASSIAATSAAAVWSKALIISALLAVPNGTGTATDLYAGAINLYKCSLSSINSTCSTTPFPEPHSRLWLRPLSALAHVHPDQHALAYTIPTSGSDLMYFANDAASIAH